MTLGPEVFSKPRARHPVKVRNWITDVDGVAPACITVQTHGQELICTVEVGEALASRPWVAGALADHLMLVRFVAPQVQIDGHGFDGLKAAPGVTRRNQYAQLCRWAFAEVKSLRAEHRVGTVPADAGLKFRWLDLTLRRLIEEEGRGGLLAPDIIRSDSVKLLEALRSPLDQVHRLFAIHHLY